MSLVLIAGEGRLPALLAQARPDARVAALEGFAPEGLEARTFRLETLGSFLAQLAGEGVTQACFAGAIRRPRVDPARIDAATLPLVPRILAAMGRGDDAALGVVLSVFEEAGITPVGAQDLVPDLLPPEGALGNRWPSDVQQRDAERAASVLDAMAAADVGQGCVVAAGQVLAMEAAPGTDWMLASLAMARASGPLATTLPPGGVLVKAPKRGQDQRVDMPTIGPSTIEAAVRAGLDGVAVAARGVLVLDRQAVAMAADAAGICVWVRP